MLSGPVSDNLCRIGDGDRRHWCLKIARIMSHLAIAAIKLVGFQWCLDGSLALWLMTILPIACGSESAEAVSGGTRGTLQRSQLLYAHGGRGVRDISAGY